MENEVLAATATLPSAEYDQLSPMRGFCIYLPLAAPRVCALVVWPELKGGKIILKRLPSNKG